LCKLYEGTGGSIKDLLIITKDHRGGDRNIVANELDFALSPAASIPSQICEVFGTTDIFVTIGVNMGDGMGALDDACLGDIYELSTDASAQKMILKRDGDLQTVADDSDVGRPGAVVRLAARFTMMAPDGDKVELLALTSDETDEYWLLPLSPIGVQIEYTLVQMAQPAPEERLMDLLCISFARGTLITLGDGSQRTIEALTAGDKILTRNNGPQELRWVGHVTLRAVGAYAPVVISTGVMGNASDLIVSQHHRMFLYQRRRAQGSLKSEILVQAKHLVDGDKIFLREGGFVDYFSLVFDSHEIIYAEGIPAESLLVSEATVSRLPPELAAEVAERFPGLSQNQHFGVEAGPLDVAALRRDAPKRGTGGC
jgi:hypothetical protein